MHQRKLTIDICGFSEIEFSNFMHIFETLCRHDIFNQTEDNNIFLDFQYCRIECMHLIWHLGMSKFDLLPHGSTLRRRCPGHSLIV